jgi:MFS family permease
VANALWELALAALKTFVVLYVTKTLGFSLAGSSGVIAGAALIVLVGAVVSGPLGDRYGRSRVMRWSLTLYGLGLLVPFATTATAPLLVAVPLIAWGGGVTMSLPYAVLIPMMPSGAGHRPVLPQPWPRHLAGSPAGRRRDPGRRPELPLGLARVLGRDPRLAARHAPAPRRGMNRARQ